jgi:decaprenyl-phosphate phosphoribosyltransferase
MLPASFSTPYRAEKLGQFPFHWLYRLENRMGLITIATPTGISRGRFAAHVALFRLDHSVKQIFVVPGIVIAMSITQEHASKALFMRCVLGMLAAVAVASSNYVLNELRDAPFDRQHPIKRMRPAACRSIHVPLAYVQWIVCGMAGLALAYAVSTSLFFSVLSLWIMGFLYNIPPIRTKDIPYIDVLSESINNPIRFCIGWYIVTATAIPPLSLLVAYWALGAYFMDLKRFSEYRQIGSESVIRYRPSFSAYSEQSLLVWAIFYAATSMLFFGAFIMRYRIEMVFAFPFIALLMAVYFNLSFKPDSPVQNPEKLYREPLVMALLVVCCVILCLTSFVHMPWLARMFPESGSHGQRLAQALVPIQRTCGTC